MLCTCFGLSAPNGQYRRADTCSRQQRESCRVCAPARVRVRLGRGHEVTFDIQSHIYAQAHTHTYSLCSSSVSSTWEMEGTTQRWITDLGDRRAFRVRTLLLPCNSYFCSFFSLLSDLHNPSMTPTVFFSSPSFLSCCFFCFFFNLPCFQSESNIVQETHLKRSVFTKKKKKRFRS